ncbi:MAG: hypothetical protein Q7T55_04250, partial [Solirubrobacteraceae bacterium]|nr:hypothetical protein [Solirubrobacteraceae bacterium]
TQQVGGAFGLAILATLAADHQTSKSVELAKTAGVKLTEQSFIPGAVKDPKVLQVVAESQVAGWSLAFLIGAGLIGLGFLAATALIRDQDADLEAGPAHIG